MDLICAVCGVTSSKSRLVDLGRWMKKRGIEIRAALATPTRQRYSESPSVDRKKYSLLGVAGNGLEHWSDETDRLSAL